MLRPTEEEMQEAAALGIDYEGMTGPQIREAIDKARRSGVRPSIRAIKKYNRLVKSADFLNIPINANDGAETIKARVEECLAEAFAQKGIQDGVSRFYR